LLTSISAASSGIGVYTTLNLAPLSPKTAGQVVLAQRFWGRGVGGEGEYESDEGPGVKKVPGTNGTNLVSGSALAAGLTALINETRPDASALPLRSWLKFVPFVSGTFFGLDISYPLVTMSKIEQFIYVLLRAVEPLAPCRRPRTARRIGSTQFGQKQDLDSLSPLRDAANTRIHLPRRIPPGSESQLPETQLPESRTLGHVTQITQWYTGGTRSLRDD